MKRIASWLLALASLAAHADAPVSAAWNFTVLLDGKPIGTHRFVLRTDGERRVLQGRAAFDFKVFGITAYRYRHEVEEQWQGDCLVTLTSKTDDDGKAFAVKSTQGDDKLDGCVMSFAYWNPALLKQARLLNAQTGKFEPVKIEALGNAKIEAQGKTVDAKRWRIVGPEQPVDLWYAADGDWLALESKVSGGKRTLSYRRE